jgi:hypothetical protein
MMSESSFAMTLTNAGPTATHRPPAEQPEDFGLGLDRIRPRMAVDLPARAGELTSVGRGVLAHCLVSDSQLRVITTVGRGVNLSRVER